MPHDKNQSHAVIAFSGQSPDPPLSAPSASLQDNNTAYRNMEISENEIGTSTSYSTSNQNQTFDFHKEIASWVVNSKTPAMHVDSLLKILQTKVPDLPKTCKSLLQTPKNARDDIIPMCQGSYLHIGLMHMLSIFLSQNNLSSRIITLDVGIDGTPTTNSSDTELWPILVNVVGFEDILLVGLYFGSGKPKDSSGSPEEFLTPFVTEVLNILEKGGISFQNEIYEIKFRAFVMDSPARAFIMNTLSHAGYHSCTKCTVPGIRIANRTVFHGVNYELRSDFTFRNRIHRNHHHSDDTTMIERLPIDCVKMVPVDPMHNIYLGVMKQLLLLWICHKRMPYSMSAKNIRLLSERILHIAKQLPSEFCRAPRPLKLLKRFKATEFRQFVLYTMVIVLEGLIPLKYYNHFLKLHCAVRILSTPDDCIRNNTLAHDLITDFVKEFGKLYGYQNSSFNVHSLLHLSQDVLNFGCTLDSYSAFKFENFLQYLKKLNRSNYRVLEQIRNRFFEKFSIDNYQGDFKKRKMRNKYDKFGNLTDVHMSNMHISVTAPNNYIISRTGAVCKIIKIHEDDTGFTLTLSKVRDISAFFLKPIPSNFLNIFVSNTDSTEDETFLLKVTETLGKVARVKINDKCFYLTLLHSTCI